MQVKFHPHSATFTREPGDPKFYGMVHAKGEHGLFLFIKRFLNARGFNLIKTNMDREGQMMGDRMQPLLRVAKKRSGDTPDIALFSGFYQIRGANEDWNKGSVTLDMETDYCQTGQDTALKLFQAVTADMENGLSMELKAWADRIAV